MCLLAGWYYWCIAVYFSHPLKALGNNPGIMCIYGMMQQAPRTVSVFAQGTWRTHATLHYAQSRKA